ncbi:MAG: NAD-dependent protein deacylase [Acholeplasmatales bacterium]|nr:NAD-dependent protein deacylase [Acholeplasmatales bacterium]
MYMNEIQKLKKAIDDSKKIVVFSGAGLSTNSGIPDFRSASGIYNQKINMNVRPEEIISHSFFMTYPDEFYKFYFDKMVYLDAKPNKAHLYFAELEKKGKVSSVVTQNIDNLHQLAGSKNVIEIHGTVMKNHCMKCHKYYDLKDILDKGIPPRCDCGGLIKPDVVLYEEGLNEDDINKALDEISSCDMLIIVGTSLVVYPAAGFVRYFNGKYLVLLNKSETQYDNNADIVIHDDVCHVVEELEKL